MTGFSNTIPIFRSSSPFGFSKQRYSSPWYFGVCRDMAWLQSFRPQDRVWLSQSPSGGGPGCPAWDFQWYIAQPQIGKRYQLSMRAAYLPLAQPNDLGAVRAEVLKAVPQASRPTPWPPDTFLHSWQVLGPIPWRARGGLDETARKKAFESDLLAAIGGEGALEVQPEVPVTIDGRSFTWRAIAETHDVIPLGTVLGLQDDAIAYAYTEVDLPEATRVSLGLGSDDGIRVWLNGVLVHENWVGREAAPDSDLIAVELQKGRNRLLVKIQNMQGPWGFACRRMGPVSLSNRLISAAYQGDLDQVRRLVELGADLNGETTLGVTPATVARIRGETEILSYLKTQGVDVSAPLPEPAFLVDRRFSSLFKTDGPAAAVLVARHGKVLLEKAYGMADIGNRLAATPETRFRIGSITKQFAAAAVLKLQEEGRVNVTNTLSQYLPDFPGGDTVTLHHLLTHTSGIHSFTSKPGFLESVTIGAEPEAHIRSFKNDPYDFSPGERWSYNNSGFFLLGSIIEKVSGQSWGDYLEQTFFRPLSMDATGVHTSKAILAHEARGYSFEKGRFQKALDWDMSKAGAAGALYSTVGDLHRWNEGVFRTQVVTTASLQAAFTPVRTRDDTAVEPGPKETGYGYGWSIAKFRGLQEISHGGGLNGFVSFLLRLPQEQFTAVVLVNCAPPPPGVDPGALAHELAEIYLADVLAPRTKPPVDTTVTEEDLTPLLGHYNYGNSFLEVTREGKRLFAQLTGQPRYEIFPRSSTNFFWKSVDAEITFVKDGQGVVTRATHQQGGQTIQAPRVADLAVVPVNAAALESYAGRYDYGGGQAILTVTREGNRLFAQLTGQPRFEIYPKSETEFQWKVVAAQVTFVKGANGKVTHVVHQQGGNRFEAPRLP
jgi:CubicO group peptidase (beta-lactamase class C family)